MNIRGINPEDWKNMLHQANSKNSGKKHSYLGVSIKEGVTYVQNFSSLPALERNNYQKMNIKEIYEVTSHILISSAADAETSHNVGEEVKSFVATKVDKWWGLKFVDAFLTTLKVIAYASIVLIPVGLVIKGLQRVTPLNKHEAEFEILEKYAEIPATINQLNAYAGENFLRTESRQLLLDYMIIYPDIHVAFDKFIKDAAKAKPLNLQMLNENQFPGLFDPHNLSMLNSQKEVLSTIQSKFISKLDPEREALSEIIYQIRNVSGSPITTQFHDDNFIFAYNKTKLDEVFYRQPLQENGLIPGFTQPILTYEDRYISHLLTQSNLYDYEKLRWIEDNWSYLIGQPDALEEQYPISGSRIRTVPKTSMRLYGAYAANEAYYTDRLERLLAKINDPTFDNPKIKEAILEIQREHGYFDGSGDGFLTKAHWDYISNDSQAFVSGTRTLGLMGWDRSVTEIKIDLDLSPLGPLTDMQCRDYFLFMKRIDNASDPSLWKYREARISNPADVEVAMACLSPEIVKKLDEIAGKINASREKLLDIAVNYSYAAIRGISLLFANKTWS